MTTLATPPLVIDFDEDAHRYLVNGEEWLSVTQILERVGLIDFSHIPKNIRLAALARGRRVHKAAHYLCEGTLDWESVAIEERGYVEACANFLATSDFDMVGQERRLAHPRFRYAGTCDGFGFWQGHFAIPDWCTGDLWESAKDLQTSGYGEALRCAPPPEWFDFTPTAPILRIGVHLHRDGTFSTEPYTRPENAADFTKFLAAATVAHEQVRRGKKGKVAREHHTDR